MDIQTYVEALTQKALQEGGRTLANPPASEVADTAEPLQRAIQGHAIELWSTSCGRLFLVADEDDARRAMANLGAPRGEIYTAAEAQRIVAVRDPEIVKEIRAWKLRFDATVAEFRREDGPK